MISMRTLFVSPSYVCNEKCIFCPCALNARKYTQLTIEELCRAVDLATEQEKIEMVLISGGEPTIYKDILNLISYIKGKGLKFGILSNSLKFSNQEFLESFIEVAGSGFELTTAFHSFMEEEHDRVTSVPGSFRKSLLGVRNLIRAGVNVTIKHIINNRTYKGLPEYTDWLYETFPDNVPWVLCNIDLTGTALTNEEDSAVPFSVSRPYLEEALDKVIEYRKRGRNRTVRIFNTPFCCIDPYYWPFLQKYESEEEMAALYLPYENPADNRIRFNLKGDGGAGFKPCKECLVQPQCPGTWKKTAEVLGDNSFIPFK